MSNKIVTLLVLLFACLTLSCATLTTAINGGIDTMRDGTGFGGTVNLGPVAVTGEYDGNVGFNVGIDLFSFTCEQWDVGCPPDVIPLDPE